MPTPRVWFKLQPHVCDSTVGVVLNRLRAGDAWLGNRRLYIHGSSTKWCPLCLNKGIVNRLSEHLVVVSCQAVVYESNINAGNFFSSPKGLFDTNRPMELIDEPLAGMYQAFIL